jgi:23S rRNA pseudouridine1911/1915/1917 synthase
MKTNNFSNHNDYDNYVVEKGGQLLDWLLENVKGESRNKLKAPCRAVASR